MIETVVIGVSAGGLKALTAILPSLPADFGLSLVILQHVRSGSGRFLCEHFNRICAIAVKDATDKAYLEQGTAYIAPAGYHLLVEDETTLALSTEPPVCFARPSIDVLFETAAEVFEDRVAGVILTGANSDGAQGLAAIKAAGGLAIVQDPKTAESPTMPRAAIKATKTDHILTLQEIAFFLCELSEAKGDLKSCTNPNGANNVV
ncbi:MAG: chemotaxis protein CheB [Halieaceae bacterium]|nr:chemotaxis protein CheB [Halieaceae bacterium]